MYIAGRFLSYYNVKHILGHFCVAETNSALLDSLFKKHHAFEIGPFEFQIFVEREYVNFPDYSVYEITHEGVTIPFQITFDDASVNYRPQSCIYLAEFIWENICIFTFRMYAMLRIPLDAPTVLYLHHHRTVSVCWRTDNLCDECCEEFRLIHQPFEGNCTYKSLCKRNVCLRQPPTLRGLASHTLFHLTFNVSEFTLTNRTPYHQYFMQ